ncbi:MAG: hypothetical protein ACOX6U_03890 [Oscillospiraceae bacterium]|jgi:hypothetical protein
MPTSKEKLEYIDKWQKENIERIVIKVAKGKKAQYQVLAEKAGAKSLTAYITTLLEEKLKEEQ